MLGRITSDIQFDHIGDKQTPVAKFSMANNRKYNGKEVAHFFDIELWGDRAVPFVKFHSKGSPCFVVGELRQDVWKDKESGQRRSRIKIAAHTWSFCGSSKGHSTQEPDRSHNRSNEADVERGDSATMYQDDNDIPF